LTTDNIIFHFKISSYTAEEMNNANAFSSAESRLKNKACSDEMVRKALEAGIFATYSFTDKNDMPFVDITVSSSDCKNE
jgi:hypothetical protein